MWGISLRNNSLSPRRPIASRSGTDLDGPAGIRIGADSHAFRVAEGSGLATARLAEEVDITLSYEINSALRLTGGWSHVWGRRGLAEIGRDPGHYTFTYLMTSVVF